MPEKELQQLFCDSHNRSEGKLHLSDGYECEKCRNKGYVVSLDQYNGHWVEVMSDCECKPMRQFLARMKKSGLANLAQKYTFKNFEAVAPWQEMLLKAACEYAKNPKGWFFISGQSGAGKSHLCTAITLYLIKHGKTAQYMLWREDSTKIKGAATDAEARESMIERFKQAELLYIDDMFKVGRVDDLQRPTAADINIAFEILNHRYNKDMPTIISTECLLDELTEIDEAIAGRIVEQAGENCFSIQRDRKKNHRYKNVVEL